MIKARLDAPDRTALERTAFCILGASTRDNRRRILELAEEKGLGPDGELCSRARADLTNPRSRLAAEVSWLPGLSPARASAYCDLLRLDVDAFLVWAASESPLVKANMINAALERFDPPAEATFWVTWIMALAEAVSRVDGETVVRLLNEDRAVAGFPEISMLGFLEAELTERRRVYRDTVKEALDRMPTSALIKVISEVADVATAAGTRPATILIDEIIDAFDVDARPFLDREAENIRRMIKAVKDSGVNNEAVAGRLLDGLERVVRNWDQVARPIHVSMSARGLEHPSSRDLAYDIRGLGIDLYNAHGLLTPAQRITTLLQDVFAGLFAVAERLQQDAGAIDNIVAQQRQAQAQSEEWAREIAFEAELGVIFKDTLRLSTAGVEWKNTRYPLESVTRIGWGVTGATYKILFGDDERLSEVQLSYEPLFTVFVARLWRAVGVRLVMELLHGLRMGKRYRFGQAIVDDRGVEVSAQHFFKADQRVYATWDRIQVWNADASFYIGVKDNEKAYAALSYQEPNNAHVIEAVIRAAFKKGPGQLSELLQSE